MLVELDEKEIEMITAFRRIFMNEKEVIEVNYINRYNYKEYIGKTVRVLGSVNLRDLSLTKLPINFTEVGGGFDCSWNELKTLEGAPKYVGGDFVCWDNPLKSTKSIPKFIGGFFRK